MCAASLGLFALHLLSGFPAKSAFSLGTFASGEWKAAKFIFRHIRERSWHIRESSTAPAYTDCIPDMMRM